MRLLVQGLRKSYGSHEVLDIPDWQTGHGIYWIQGENGAGKSTLFRALAGMLPCQGHLWLDGTYELRKHPVEYRRRVSLGEAEPLYPDFLTPADLLEFVAEARQSPRGQAAELVSRLGIDYLRQPLGGCSSGMVKKVSLALAFLGAPRLIILDEPLITIDQPARAALFDLIRSTHAGGTSFLLSSHQPFESAELPLTGSFRLANKTLLPQSTP
jgi:ABC-2 type transport system ATP-binding protein